ncbi:putative drug exporter of the RND superfamily [Tessaracoccus bendigoensis DSM 12906]|uniref:Putative drug exporter of the RND superfamily n=1 Tax=Tessaracoccus bendigoensis DSM 12906 TaxID=1123357 RepID=A0A1M6B5X4_9ACTN|nr:MMPL family transporter [Tessaracoccus bendigoensis]SHI44154.1 putative drug exporter of the RND superfamily [Tessaracoccus bendigoensis DSM 12906]
MSAWLYALGRWCYRRRKTVIAAWLATLVALGGLGVAFMGSFNNAFDIPSSKSQAALDNLRMTFPEAAALSATAVVVAPEGDTVEEYRTEIEAAVEEFGQVDEVETATSPWSELATGLVSDEGNAAVIQLGLDFPGVTPTAEDLAPVTAVADDLRDSLPEGAIVTMGGEAYNIELPALTVIEAIGLVVALVVLTVLLGSLVAAGLPLLTAITGVGIAMSIMLLMTNLFDINSTTPLLSVMLGLAVGIDYALFILSRHRDQLREGMDPEESAGRAVGTSGSAVVFAGLTVFIALIGLGVAQIPFLTVMGLFAAATVAIAVLIALTFLPALMGVMGERMRPKPRKAVAPGHAKKARNRKGAFEWWVGVTTSHPIVTIVIVVAGLVGLTIPTVGLQVSLPNAGQQAATSPARVAYDLMDEHFGPGSNGPIIVTADIIGATDPIGVLDGLKADIEAMPGVAQVPIATPNANVDTGMIQVVPTTGPDDPATADLVRSLRDHHDDWASRYGVSTSVTGFTAIAIDVSDKLTEALLPFGILVVGLSLVLLAAVFRSVWVPVKATLGYLLSVGAAFGVTTLVFNHGWLKELVNLEKPMPVISFLPILLMGILFGLAMDYEVFLVSRMREEYVHGKSAVEAVRNGFVASGPVVAAAAVIMCSVFAFFVPEGMAAIKAIALALAVGVAVDAFLVRMTLVPAVMTLLGDKAWWLPKWLDKLLPTFDVEGEALTTEMALRGWPGDDSVAFADGLTVEGIVQPIHLRLVPGNVVAMVGPVGARTGAALALSGRLETTGGKARVAGALLPQGAGRVRRRVTYLDLAVVDAPASALRNAASGTVVFVDTVELADGDAAREALDGLIARTRESGGAVVLCGSSVESLSGIEIDGTFTVPNATLEGSNA